MSDSIAQNSIVSNEIRGIIVSESHNNAIYNDTVSNSNSETEDKLVIFSLYVSLDSYFYYYSG